MFTDVLAGYFASTENNLNATVHYLVINLHAAASASDPTGSVEQPVMTSLPDVGQSISSLLVANNSAYLFTPPDLAKGRADLNATGGWFDVQPPYEPVSAYMTINNFDGSKSSPDGWPSEAYAELLRYRRMLAAFGRVDPQMQKYNFSGDSDYIFSRGFLTSQPDITFTASGEVANGCFFRPGGAGEPVSAANSSWAVYPVNSPQRLEQAGNLTACGISPMFNASTLVPNGTSADVSYAPYADLVSAHIWSWDTEEPRNASSTVNGADDSSKWFCALLNATSGRWQAGDCTQAHYGACRVRSQPYEWDISRQRGSYYQVNAGCRESDDFAVPRSGLENSYLVSKWQNYVSDHGGNDGDTMLWLNFNDLDVRGCWVIGQNTSCPYRTNAEVHHQGRRIIVSVVAAIIVFVLAALTMFVKCAANRRSTKRRMRRGTEGWDYEGVPS